MVIPFSCPRKELIVSEVCLETVLTNAVRIARDFIVEIETSEQTIRVLVVLASPLENVDH